MMWEWIPWLLIFIVCGIAFYTDHTRLIIPNWLTMSGVVSGLFVHVAASGWQGLKQSFVGLCTALICVLILYWCRSIGAGDVKLFAAFGAIGGWEISLYGLIYSLLAAAGYGLILIGWRLMKAQSFRGSKGERLQFPFMYAVLPGFVMTLWLLEVQAT